MLISIVTVMRSSRRRLLSFASLLLFAMVIASCNYIKEENKKVFLIISPKDHWPSGFYMSNDTKINGDTKKEFFKVHLDNRRDADTTLIDRTNFNKNDTCNINVRGFLYSDNPISIEQFELFLLHQGIHNHTLREDLYWLSRLTQARLIQKKNVHGDVIGYYVKVGNEYVPEKYYSIENYLGEIVLKQKLIELAHQEANSNSFNIYMTLFRRKPNKDNLDIKDYKINSKELFIPFYNNVNTFPLSFKTSKIGAQPVNGIGISVRIEVNSVLKVIINNGEIKYVTTSELFPYNFRIENI